MLRTKVACRGAGDAWLDFYFSLYRVVFVEFPLSWDVFGFLISKLSNYVCVLASILMYICVYDSNMDAKWMYLNMFFYDFLYPILNPYLENKGAISNIIVRDQY